MANYNFTTHATNGTTCNKIKMISWMLVPTVAPGVRPCFEALPHCKKWPIVTSQIIGASWNFTNTNKRPQWHLEDVQYGIHMYINNKGVSQQVPESANHLITEKCNSYKDSFWCQITAWISLRCSSPQGLDILMWYFKGSFGNLLSVLEWSKWLYFAFNLWKLLQHMTYEK